MRQAGADDDERQAAAGEISWQAAHSAETSSGAEVLHLVDEDRDALPDVGGQAADVGEQLDEVDLDVAGVGAPG